MGLPSNGMIPGNLNKTSNFFYLSLKIMYVVYFECESAVMCGGQRSEVSVLLPPCGIQGLDSKLSGLCMRSSGH